ncbi:MAG: Omp28-related outer membrane protein, partial [Bacteroidales bacterium]|nr:Omp28-related outer membrane protein [Bacteroidales bacterium]
MKRTILVLLVIALCASLGMSQSQRLVLLEHFTQASCGPCATYNPGVQAILTANPDKITYIKYQTSWPGYDPMNLHNPTEVASRVGYYGVSGVPHSVLDGNYYDGSASGWNVGTVNNRYAISTPIEIQMQHSLSAAQDSVHVTMLVKATGPVSGNLVAMIGVVEKHIQFTVAPGSNGEKNFYNVMKKFLPNTLGSSLPSSMSAGDYVIFRYSWKLANFYNIAQLGVVGWVQNKTTKEILQAANSTTNPIIPLHANDGALSSVLGIGNTWCQDDIAPSVILRNQGSLPLTSAEVKYSVNGGAAVSQAWTGNLGFLQEATIPLPLSTFNLSLDNHISIYLNQVNGTSDGYTSNDSLGRAFGLAPGTSEKVYLYLKLDNNPQQTT